MKPRSPKYYQRRRRHLLPLLLLCPNYSKENSSQSFKCKSCPRNPADSSGFLRSCVSSRWVCNGQLTLGTLLERQLPQLCKCTHRTANGMKGKRLRFLFLPLDQLGSPLPGAHRGGLGSGAASYLSGCWETRARGRWRACGRTSRAFADPSRWLKMRLQSGTVTIHPAKDTQLLLNGEPG